mgnify:CR=1 FL=1
MGKVHQIINYAFLHRLPIKVYHYGELIGAGIIVEHTKHFIKLDDGQYYMKRNCDFIVKKSP